MDGGTSNDLLFKKLFDKYYTSLLYFAIKLIKVKPDAEDIVMQVFLSLLESGKIENELSIKAFLFTATRNKCVNYFYSKQVADKYQKFAIENTELYTQRSDKDLTLLLYKCINALPKECQAVMKLLIIDDLTTKEIAEKLNIKTNTVRVHRLNAIKAFKQKLLIFKTLK